MLSDTTQRTEAMVCQEVLQHWRQRLANGEWVSLQDLVRDTPSDLCNALLQLRHPSMWQDCTDPREVAWEIFKRDSLPTLLDNDEYERKMQGGQKGIQYVGEAPAQTIGSPGKPAPNPRVDLESEVATTEPASTKAPAKAVHRTTRMKTPTPPLSKARSTPDKRKPNELPATDDIAQDNKASNDAAVESVSTAAAIRNKDTPAVDTPPDTKLLPLSPTTLPIESIRLGTRYRKVTGDLDALAESIRKLGLLHPPVVTRDGQLVVGWRRLQAHKLLGKTEIPVMVVDNLDDTLRLLEAERDENECRQGYAPSEAVALGEAIEAVERPQSKQRQREHGGTAPGRRKNTAGKLPGVSGAKTTRDQAARAAGMSSRNYGKAKAVVEAAKADPERFGAVAAQMDESGKVDPAYQKVKQARAAGQKSAAATQPKTAPSKADQVSTTIVTNTDESLTITRPADDAQFEKLAQQLRKFLGCHNTRMLHLRLWKIVDLEDLEKEAAAEAARQTKTGASKGSGKRPKATARLASIQADIAKLKASKFE